MSVKVEFTGKKSFKAIVAGHEIVTDLPVEKGGDYRGTTSLELFIASKGCCVGIFAVSYKNTAKLDPEGFSVDVDWALDETKTRVGSFNISLQAPSAEFEIRKKALLIAAEKCIVHNTLENKPDIKFTVTEDATGSLNNT